MRTLLKTILTLAIFSLCRPVAAEGKMQHWLRVDAIGLTNEGSPLFYVNKEDSGKILLLLGEEGYLLETRFPSVVRVTSAIPKANEEFEVGEIQTEALKDMTATIQHIAGTPKFAGGMYWLGWSICFQKNGKPDADHTQRCYTFARFEEDSSWKESTQDQNRLILKRVPIRIGGNVLESRLIHKVEPVYPEEAKSPQLSGKVVLLVTVNEIGAVSFVRVVSGDPKLADSAIAAVKQWRYSPTLLNGEPVPVEAMVTVIFSLTGLEKTVGS